MGIPWPDCIDWDDIEDACEVPGLMGGAGGGGPMFAGGPPCPDDADGSEASDCPFGEGNGGDTSWVDDCGD